MRKRLSKFLDLSPYIQFVYGRANPDKKVKLEESAPFSHVDLVERQEIDE